MRIWLLRIAGLVCLASAGAIALAVGLPDPARLLAQRPAQPGESPVAAVSGAVAPDFQVTDAFGEPIHLAALRGSPVILNFWATWCQPCAIELPDLQQLYAAGAENGLYVLAVNVDEPPAVFIPWAADRGLTFDLLADPDQRLQTLFRVRGVPQTVVIDSAGTIREIFYGPVDGATLIRVLNLETR